jgi:hypothetical protein
MFNVWLMLGVLGISVRRELGLTDAQLEWLIFALACAMGIGKASVAAPPAFRNSLSVSFSA